jgi:hypothetical protein
MSSISKVLKRGKSTVLMLRLAFNTLRKVGFFPSVLSRPAEETTAGEQAVKTFSNGLLGNRQELVIVLVVLVLALKLARQLTLIR